MKRGSRGGKKDKMRRKKERRREVQQKISFLKLEALRLGHNLTARQLRSAVWQLRRKPALSVYKILKSFNLMVE